MPLALSYLAAITGTVLAACVVYNAVQGVRVARRMNRAAERLQFVESELARLDGRPRLRLVRGGKR